MKVEIKLLEVKKTTTTKEKIRLLMESYPEFPEYVKRPKKPKNATKDDLVLYESEMAIFKKADSERDKKCIENKLIREAIDEKIEAIMRKDSGLLKIPKQYQEKVWEIAFREGYNHGYKFVYLDLCELVSIFK